MASGEEWLTMVNNGYWVIMVDMVNFHVDIANNNGTNGTIIGF